MRHYRLYKTQGWLAIYNYTKRQNDKDTTFAPRIYQRLFCGTRGIACVRIFWHYACADCASFLFPSLESLAEYVAMGGALVALSAVLVVALFYLCLPMFLLSYVPCKIVQGIFSIFVEFVSDEEYERYKEDKT